MILCCFACGDKSNDGESEDNISEVIPYEELSLPDGCRWDRDSIEQKEVTLINSQAELNKYITGQMRQEIDFEKKMLILAGGLTTSGINKITSRLVSDSTQLIVEIEIHLSISANIDHWVRAFMVAKRTNTSVNLKITEIEIG
jgi:hypothetical protein